MLQSEFEKLTDRPFTTNEFEIILYVHRFHPAAKVPLATAQLWTLGGIRLFRDMLPTAKTLRTIEENVKSTQAKVDRLKREYDAICNGWSKNEND